MVKDKNGDSKMLVIGTIFIIVIIIIILAVLLLRCKNGENFCGPCTDDESKENGVCKSKTCGTCQGIGNKVCIDRELLNKMYVSGDLTENSDLIKSKKWT